LDGRSLPRHKLTLAFQVGHQRSAAMLVHDHALVIVMPRITSGNTDSRTIIAEKAAEMILADAKAAR
jgi:hypothetical protein